LLKVLNNLYFHSDFNLQTEFEGVFGGRGPGGVSPPAASKGGPAEATR